ncbi:MAG: EcsC family protein [Psychrobacter sp.]|uniref:EcsC family protein n=1 Tax=Psychrobacter sp. TaxID=56811 RepID=UPI002648EA31|nr:EcsC family protein [Psychrobacter sp.]MDN5619596.1 EcsC family protein [Psychrobacter sp.]
MSDAANWTLNAQEVIDSYQEESDLAGSSIETLDDTNEMIKDPEKQAFNQINEEVMSRVLRQTATKVATNMVKTKAAQVIPAVGAVVAGGVNANYTANV